MESMTRASLMICVPLSYWDRKEKLKQRLEKNNKLKIKLLL